MKSFIKVGIKKSFFSICIFSLTVVSVFAFPRPKGQNLNTICNIVSTDMLKKKIGEKESISFPGIYNETKVDVQTDRINLGIDVTFGFGANPEDSYSSINWIDLDQMDWYVEFSPEKEVIAFLHDKIFISGAYLPVSKTYIPASNSGSDVGGVLKPIDEIRFCAGIDFPSYFGRDEWDPCLNVGLDYFNPDFGGLGISVRNIATKDRSISISGTFTKIQNLIISFGFTDDSINKTLCMGYPEHYMTGDLLSFSVDYTFKSFKIQAETIINLDGSDININDFYFGTRGTFTLSNSIDIFAEYKTIMDFDLENNGLTYIIKPGFNINYYGTNQITAAVQFYITQPDCYLNIPLTWKYSF